MLDKNYKKKQKQKTKNKKLNEIKIQPSSLDN
jgi:hypothetical protein